MKTGILISSIGALLISGCSSSSSDPVTQPAANSLAGLENCIQADANQTLLCGTAVAADGVTPLIGAEIALDSTSAVGVSSSASLRGIANESQCITDSQGEYSCVLPADTTGITRFELTANGFSALTFEENIQPGRIAAAQPLILIADNSLQWAVVPGEFDGVQVLLAQLKGCTLTDAAGNPWIASNPDSYLARGSTDCESKGLRVLENGELDFYTDGSLDQFDALFINCDTDLRLQTDINAAINEFNANGNHVYFSDLSDGWLSAIFPDQINFAGNETQSDDSFPATVVDPSLAAVVGNNIDLVFDFSVWTAIDSVSANSTVYIEADISEISSYVGVKPITVGFKPEGADACVFFTSYHIEGASTGSDQELAIKYLVQNIGTVCA